MVVDLKVGAAGVGKKYVGATEVQLNPDTDVVVSYTPSPPVVTSDDINNTVTAFHTLGNSEILYSENGGPFQQYGGPISVGNVTRAAGYYMFKIKATANRNESSVAGSPAFTAVVGNITPAAPILTQDDVANTISAYSPLGASEILVNGNNTYWAPYPGTISVGNVAQPQGYWKFKVRAAQGRNESAVSESQPFTVATSVVTPEAPTLQADDVNNTLIATSSLGISEILVSENNGAYTQYTGTINVGNVARAAGYWKFKTKSATNRNESPVASSPAFTAIVITTPAAPTLNGDDVNNILTASSSLGISEIVYSENNGSFVAYTGPISVGNIDRAAGYFKFKIKAATGRNESSVVSSPPFTYTDMGAVPNSYTLGAASTVSGGIYRKSDNVLVRTLLSGQKKLAGTYPINWDGTDDFINPLPGLVTDYRAKFITNNINYLCEGTVGNNSINSEGQTVHSSLDPLIKLVIIGTKAHFIVGYNEAQASHAQFDINSPKVRISPFDAMGNQTTDYIATNGTNIYLTAFDNYENANSFVYAYNASTNAIIAFSAGVSYKVKYGNQFNNAIGYRNDGVNAYPTGLAVSSNYIFISRKGLNVITVLNINTGAFVRDISISQPGHLACEGNFLWVNYNGATLEKRQINSDGTLGGALLSIPNLSQPADIRINGSTIAVIDSGTSQTVKVFNTSTGSSNWTLGKAGGALTSPVVENDRYGFFRINEDTRLRMPYGGIAFASDGSIWIADPSNCRVAKYDSSRNYLDAIIYQPKTYSCFVNPNDPSQVLGNFMQFQVNYISTIKNAWSLKYNWQGYLQTTHNPRALKGPVTLSNGRVYGLFGRMDNIMEVIEFDPINGIRYTGITSNLSSAEMDKDGNIYGVEATGTGEKTVWKKQVRTGFSGINPVYSAAVVILTAAETAGDYNPRLSGAHIRPWEKTSGNVLVNYRGNIDSYKVGDEKFVTEPYGAYHIGGMNPDNGSWLWKALPATYKEYSGEYPLDFFDVGNGVPEYAGNVALAIDKHIFAGYNGEGYKQSQVNKWTNIYENGLLLGQFGATGQEYNFDQSVFSSFAGNAFSPDIIKVGNDYYLYHNDESLHGGLMRWKITGLDTVIEQITDLTSAFVKGPEDVQPGIDLHANLPFNTNITTNTAGWIFSPLPSGNFKVVTNAKSYSKREPNDLFLTNSNNYGGTWSAVKPFNIGTNLSTWEVSGKINWAGSMPNFLDKNGLNVYFDILDTSGRTIARLFHTISFGTVNSTTIYANGSIIASGTDFTTRYSVRVPNKFSFRKSGTSIIVNFATFNPVTLTAPFETGAAIGSPASVRVLFEHNGQGNTYEKFISLMRLRAVPNV